MKTFVNNTKTKIIVIALVVGLPLQMCTTNNDDCNCGPIAGEFFDITGMDLSSYERIDENEVEILEENEAVAYDTYDGIQLEYDVDFISEASQKSLGFSLISSAYACSCKQDGYAGSKFEKLSNLTVTTLNDFDEDHLAGSVINDLIVVKSSFRDANGEYLQDFLENYAESNISDPYLNLKVDRKPILDENFKVRVKVELSTGEVYEEVTSNIILQ
ncbi:hypothetical protein [Aequorivita echinoideorum]|uniref:DUF5034 domain-containing protein n=1 Tax=Aequorivita echinoideorum TaxID=1549647 RepID=A0ABS5S2M9_9FLAO|nr:hypothetical protein [Aequorivita echinoideorum]MBT0607463.1 hypothetical protein [Aequorivita echinoideorum]